MRALEVLHALVLYKDLFIVKLAVTIPKDNEQQEKPTHTLIPAPRLVPGGGRRSRACALLAVGHGPGLCRPEPQIPARAMDAFTHELIAATDNLKEAHLELATGLLHKTRLCAMSSRLDALEADVLRCQQHFASERSALALLQHRLQPFRVARPARAISFATESTDLEAPRPALATLSPLSDAEFEAVPRYLRGRLTLARLSTFVADFNALLVDKYTLLQRTSAARLPPEQRQRYVAWKSAEQDDSSARGRPFLTEADLRHHATDRPFRFDQTARNMLIVLRQAGRIKELRSPGVIRYVVL